MAWRLTALALALLVLVPVALAQSEEDRVRLRSRGFSSATVVVVPVGPEFRRLRAEGDSGSWEGPVCERGAFTGPVALSWSVGFTAQGSAADAARTAMTFRWAVVETATIPVRHLVGGRDAGTIPGTLIVTDSQSPQGWHEAGLGFPIGRGYYAGAKAWSRGNTFACIVRSAQGPVQSSTWHRLASAAALRGLRLEGSLPPALVTARGSTSRVTGAARDSFGHPVAGAAVVLQRRIGGAWRRAAAGTTTRRGSYALPARRRGAYRAIATLARSSARSRVVRAGR